MKHISFITDENLDQHFNIIKNKLVKKYNENIYQFLHVDDIKKIEDCNLTVFLTRISFEKIYQNNKFGKFFKDDKDNYIFSFDILNCDYKVIKELINNFLQNFAILKVNNDFYTYRDINFKKITEKNGYIADYMFVEDENGEYLSYDGKKLKKVPKYKTNKQTYNGHLQPKDLFYYEKYPFVANSRCWSYLTWDIETNMSLDIINTPEPIISITCYSNQYNKYFVWILKKNKDQKINLENFNENEKLYIFDDEKSMLSNFVSFLEKIDIDILAGYNSDKFDFPYFINRCNKLSIDCKKCFGYIHESFNKDGSKTYDCEKIFLWDYLVCLKFINGSKNKAASWRLNSVAKYYLNEEKLDHEGIKYVWENDIEKLIKYNIRDVYLTENININQRLFVFPLLYLKFCPQDLKNFYFTSKIVENVLHQRFKPYKFPTKNKKEGDKIKGALVIKPKTGHYKNVSVFDYSGMYPSLVVTFNLSPETIIENEDFDPNKHANINNIIYNQTKKGTLVKLAELLINERKKIKTIKNSYDGNSVEFKEWDAKEQCFKKLVNSGCYGVLLYKNFILYNEKVGSTITYLGREMLKFTKDVVENNGYINLFGDTDSVHISMGDDENFHNIIKKSKDFADYFNDKLKEYIFRYTKYPNAVENSIMNIALDKIYEKFFLSEAKKKQFGYLRFKKGKYLEKKELSYVGMEALKSDTPVFFKGIYKELYTLILDDFTNYEKFREFAKETWRKLLKTDYNNLIIKKKLSKEMDGYDNNPLHLRALKNAEAFIDRGEEVNMLYVEGSREVIHYEENNKLNFKINYDRYYKIWFKNKVKLLNVNLYNNIFLYKNEGLFNNVELMSYKNLQKMREKKPKMRSLLND